MKVHDHLHTIYRQLGINRVFAIPGDYNVAYLDRLAEQKDIASGYCTNELNMGPCPELVGKKN